VKKGFQDYSSASAVHRNQTHDLKMRQQRKRRVGPCPVMLCSLCCLLFKTSCSQSNIPRPGTASRPEPRSLAEETDARRHRGRGEGLHGGPCFLLFLCALCSAISRIHSFLTKLFHHEEHEGHEVLNMTDCTIFLRDLRVLRGENWVAAGRAATLR